MKQLFLCCLLLTGYQTVLAQPLTARQIIDKTIAAYKAANTYQDTGEVILHAKNSKPAWYDTGELLIKKPYKTVYIRKSGQFRYSYRDLTRGAPATAFVAWSDGKQHKVWKDITKSVRSTKTLAAALSGAGGVSGGSSYRAVSLLIPGTPSPNWTFEELQKLVLLPQTAVAGKTCYHLQGTTDWRPVGATAKSPRPITGPTESHPDIQIWIDTTTFLLIRIAELYNQGTTAYEYSITYYPLLNQPIKPEALVFDYQRFQ